MPPIRHHHGERESHIHTSPNARGRQKARSTRGKRATSRDEASQLKEDEEIQFLEDLGLPEQVEPIVSPGRTRERRRRPSTTSAEKEKAPDFIDLSEEEPEHEPKDAKQSQRADTISAGAEAAASSSSQDAKAAPKTDTQSGSQRKSQERKPSPGPTMVDYYKVLDLPRNATTVDIKKAYRRLALIWHPDKNPDNQDQATIRFKELSEAYEVLADEKKRRVYDQYGKEGLNNNAGRPSGRTPSDDFAFGYEFSHFNFGFPGFSFRAPEDVFRDFFRDNPMADFIMADEIFEGPRSRNSRARHPHGHSSSRPQSSQLSTQLFNQFGFGMNPMGMGGMGMLDDFFTRDPFFSGGSGNYCSTTTFGSAAPSAGGSGAIKKTSTTTRMVNGKKLVTKRVTENGVETVTVTENGIMKSKEVNGVPQRLAY